MSLVVTIIGLALGEPTALDGKFLKEYDPSRPGVAPDGRPMPVHIVVTDDRAEAMRFESAAEFHKFYTAIDPKNPTRPDGLPNRPLTAFTLAVDTDEET